MELFSSVSISDLVCCVRSEERFTVCVCGRSYLPLLYLSVVPSPSFESLDSYLLPRFVNPRAFSRFVHQSCLPRQDLLGVLSLSRVSVGSYLPRAISR